jgi:predicted DsbA family dithiol-disulfide isomerase
VVPVPVVEVFADVLCPFTHVLLEQYARRRDELGLRQRLRVRAWPLELVNGEPTAIELLATEVAALRDSMAPESFRGFDPASFPRTSLPALELAAGAYAVADSAGERVSLALRRAVFEDGRDVSDRDVLAAVADAADVDLPDAGSYAATVEDEWTEGRRRGVEGSPHFFVGTWHAFAPGLRVDEHDGSMRVLVDPAGFEELVKVGVAAERTTEAPGRMDSPATE